MVVAGSLSSNLWMSENGGDTWAQLEWPQPEQGQFGVPGAIGGACTADVAVGPDSARWRVDRDPRFLADITGDRRADIVGFGEPVSGPRSATATGRSKHAADRARRLRL